MQSIEQPRSDDGQVKVQPISSAYQRLSEAEVLLIKRVMLERNYNLSDEEYVSRDCELQMKEAAWAKRWGI